MRYEMNNEYCDNCCSPKEIKKCKKNMMEGRLPLCWEETFINIEAQEREAKNETRKDLL